MTDSPSNTDNGHAMSKDDPAVVIAGGVRNLTVENVKGGSIAIAGDSTIKAKCRDCNYEQTLHGHNVEIVRLKCPMCGGVAVSIKASNVP